MTVNFQDLLLLLLLSLALVTAGYIISLVLMPPRTLSKQDREKIKNTMTPEFFNAEYRDAAKKIEKAERDGGPPPSDLDFCEYTSIS